MEENKNEQVSGIKQLQEAAESIKIVIADTAENTMPDPVRYFFEKNGITEYQLEAVNERKGRYCYSYEKAGARFFLKWNRAGESYQLYHDALTLEHTVYRTLQGQGLTPVYIEREDAPELLITEYMETEGTLREVLKNLEEAGDTERIYRLVSALFRKWCNYVKLLSAESEAMNLSGTGEELYTKYLNSLYLSGPFDTKGKRVEMYRNRVVNKLTKKLDAGKVREMIGSLDYEVLPVVHGDFHANNILVAGDEPVILDLESTRTGIPEIELAYMYAQIAVLIRSRKELIRKLNTFINREVTVLRDRHVFWEFFRTYYTAARRNHRFY